MKIIGLISVWAGEELVIPAIEQALKYCDEVLLCVSSFSELMKKYEDKTSELALTYKDKIKIVEYDKPSFAHITRADILNEMLKHSDNFEVGNWLWILDVDEFYNEDSFDYIYKQLNTDTEYTQYDIEERYFFINMKYYLKGSHLRLFKINSLREQYVPTQNWASLLPKVTGKIDIEFGMLHYGMILNSQYKADHWESEFPYSPQINKTNWLKDIYFNFDVKDQEHWMSKNYEMSGYRGVWVNDGFKGDENGFLFEYDGSHPDFIIKNKLHEVEDFRKFYEKK